MVGPRGPNDRRCPRCGAVRRSTPPRMLVSTPVGRLADGPPVGRLEIESSTWQTAFLLFFFFLHFAISLSSSWGSARTALQALLVMSPLCRHFATSPRILVISDVGRLV